MISNFRKTRVFELPDMPACSSSIQRGNQDHMIGICMKAHHQICQRGQQARVQRWAVSAPAAIL